ncbi:MULTISPECIES: penicillin-binding protein 2 [Prochlorococcus]|uniref:Cell division protein FtsI/penicillin-binding protein 2 n=1 Tax=Prochlorococcus marinus (strain SARG / CCMP1375 / SS120) TaxID=167539 RepID=Q7VEH2_PROMA|nr:MULTISPECIES: penicillin-binding protein 2 [Prochlorococcus]AAP99087.1 Cell division protein FtsI/penicillin-binding protein 2 [Prochlorococcus marinus subsp. marinus str. CCMP1375]KGG11656.1 Cell division protein FtsI (Peptidoglycan synthetase) [Prochlorococcus marinus str. LG]KGG22336.1 Cell division protein FtsI (Peptidoglycan synthetase) [Prochlorococcus marinus str. SS2]KGG22671.1 Cell division protein FtsI (Peptidoglycan synthetase) [Prochlorococcus marinus str. SS35]KGG32907.1 Cell d
MNVKNDKKSNFTNQSNTLVLIIGVIFSLISGRLFWLQIIKGSFYRTLSDQNRIRLVSNPPIRGTISDAKGNLLVDNKLRFALIAQPHLIAKDKWPKLLKRLSRILETDRNSLDNLYREGVKYNDFSITLLSNMTKKQVLRFQEQQSTIDGVNVSIDLIRHYPNKNFASHVLGYTQLITRDEYKKLSKQGYKIKDVIGRSGLEAAFESHLRGEWGGEMLEVDASGRIQRSLGFKPPKQGNNLKLTLDFELQKAAEKALTDKIAGAIVVLDPNTGAIKAMASKPSFDPNFFTKPIRTQKEFEKIFLSSSKPLLSRALNAYDPGSTWKIVTGMAGMESGKFQPDVILETAPCLQYGGHCFPEHNRKGWGSIGYEDAFRVSSNTFFYQVGVGVGIKELHKAALQLGFNTRTGIEIADEESKGFVGTEEWAAKGRGWGRAGTTPWIPEDIASASIGQAVVQVTPLQLARAYAVFANGGYLITPHFVDGDIDWLSSKYRKKVDIKPTTLKTIREGLKKVVESGTGRSLRWDLPTLPPLAGKTGTAEDSSGGKDHAWFACFAPYELSEIVIVAFAQNTPGGGSVHALPMAQNILKIWYQSKL